jgi:acetoacetyl-CoA reductase
MERMTAVVTGGTGEIGTAICKRLATNYQVIACYFFQ